MLPRHYPRHCERDPRSGLPPYRYLLRSAVAASALSVLASCGFGLDYTASGFASVADGAVDKDIEAEENSGIRDAEVGAVYFLTGLTYQRTGGSFDVRYGTYYAFSGIEPGWDVGLPPPDGTVFYNGGYAYLIVDDVNDTWFGIYGNEQRRGGQFTLIADFDAGTLTGEAEHLTVDGIINGDDLSGEVTMIFYPDRDGGRLTGKLDGYIGDTGVIGAFHGHDKNTVGAGGIVGQPEL